MESDHWDMAGGDAGPAGSVCACSALDDADPVQRGFYIIERKVFDHYLFEAAIGRGARDYTGYSLTDAEFEESDELWHLTLREQSGAIIKIRCRILVGADGAGSRGWTSTATSISSSASALMHRRKASTMEPYVSTFWRA